MSKFELFSNVLTIVNLPLLLVYFGIRIHDLYKVRFTPDKITWLDVISIVLILMTSFNVVRFAVYEQDNFMMTLGPTFMGFLIFIFTIIITDYINKNYFRVPLTAIKVNIFSLFCIGLSSVIAFINAVSGEYVINIWMMVLIAFAGLLINLSLFLTVPLMKNLRILRIGKTLGSEKQKLFRKEELAIKRMPSTKLYGLFQKYRSLSEEDYDKFEKYSADKNYPYPLIKGKELVNFHLRIICKELTKRHYEDGFWR